jgi:hypothetical protein
MKKKQKIEVTRENRQGSSKNLVEVFRTFSKPKKTKYARCYSPSPFRKNSYAKVRVGS